MIKILLTVAVLGSMGFAGLAMAEDKQEQGKKDQTFGSDISAVIAKLEAQCAHRRIMPPDPRNNCASRLRELRGEAQVGAAPGSQADGPGKGNGPGNGNGFGLGNGNGVGPGSGNGIGPGSGGGKGRGR